MTFLISCSFFFFRHHLFQQPFRFPLPLLPKLIRGNSVGIVRVDRALGNCIENENAKTSSAEKFLEMKISVESFLTRKKLVLLVTR